MFMPFCLPLNEGHNLFFVCPSVIYFFVNANLPLPLAINLPSSLTVLFQLRCCASKPELKFTFFYLTLLLLATFGCIDHIEVNISCQCKSLSISFCMNSQNLHEYFVMQEGRSFHLRISIQSYFPSFFFLSFSTYKAIVRRTSRKTVIGIDYILYVVDNWQSG